MANGGISSSNLADLNNQLAQALQDPSNQALYQNLQTGQLQNLEAQLQAAINYAANNGQSAIANEILNDPGAQLRLMDYANQLPGGITPGGLMEQFLAGDSVYMPATGNTLTIDPNQSLDAQPQIFYQNTLAGASQTPGRVDNLNSAPGNIFDNNSVNNQNGGVLGLQLSYYLGNAQQQVVDDSTGYGVNGYDADGHDSDGCYNSSGYDNTGSISCNDNTGSISCNDN